MWEIDHQVKRQIYMEDTRHDALGGHSPQDYVYTYPVERGSR